MGPTHVKMTATISLGTSICSSRYELVSPVCPTVISPLGACFSRCPPLPKGGISLSALDLGFSPRGNRGLGDNLPMLVYTVGPLLRDRDPFTI